jgi:hypothetical protein
MQILGSVSRFVSEDYQGAKGELQENSGVVRCQDTSFLPKNNWLKSPAAV